MTDWQEINDLKRNPQAVRALAKRLLKLTYVDWREELFCCRELGLIERYIDIAA